MYFTSDSVVTKKGFKFDIICKDPSEKEEVSSSKNVLINNAYRVNDYFAKEVSCLTLSDSVQYRFCCLIIC